MQQIFVSKDAVNQDEVHITGQDVKHMKNVLRMKPGDKIRVSVSDGKNYFAILEEFGDQEILAKITDDAENTELPSKIYLFQGIPKGERMETVIEKAVELGVYEIIPVEMKYCVVKLDAKKKEARRKRYQAIAESAARQSKRSMIPVVKPVMTYKEALAYAMANCDVRLLPYENKDGMEATRLAMKKVIPGKSVGMFIGPEGGFAPEEVELAAQEMEIISLGKRILRTDTAAITTMSLVMLALEMQS